MQPSGRDGFKKINRLTRPAEFQHVFSTSCRSRDAQFLVMAIGNGKSYPRLGMVVSKKSLKLAVSRNRVKRQIRESFRRNSSSLSGLDIVVMAHRDAALTDHKKIQHSLQKHWERVVSCKD